MELGPGNTEVKGSFATDVKGISIYVHVYGCKVLAYISVRVRAYIHSQMDSYSTSKIASFGITAYTINTCTWEQCHPLGGTQALKSGDMALPLSFHVQDAM